MSETPFSVPNSVAEMAEYVLSVLGADAYLVGGSVRDFILGIEPKDFDFTTSLTPGEVGARIEAAGRRPYRVGERFGTLGLKNNGNMAEITTFRTETYDGTSRKPVVEFVGRLEDDLSRRDFTINAMAYDHRRRVVIDPFGGLSDTSAGVLRSVGSPRSRFKEDPLRVLRLARFAARFGFEIEEKTMAAAKEQAASVTRVSHERWNQELGKLLLCPNAHIGLMVLAETEVLRFVLPELWLQVGYDQNNPHHALGLWEHTLEVVKNTRHDDIYLRWAALLHDVGKPFARRDKPTHSTYVAHELIGKGIVSNIGHWLKWSKEQTLSVASLVESHMEDDSPLREADKAGKVRV